MKQKQSSKNRSQQQQHILSEDGQMSEITPTISAPGDAISEAEIASRAYEEFEKSGHQHGNDVEHWCTAESRIAAERSF